MVFMPKFNHLLTAGFVLAMAFTFSCNLGVGGGCQPSWLCPSGSEYKGGSCNAADYEPVNIGGQIWMAKNWGCYAPGSGCYEHKDANCEKYGRLYDWATAMTVCPSGWHLPSDEDWDKLMNAVGGSSTAGRYLKTSDWGGENKYGFSALPGGYVNLSDNIYNSYHGGSNGYWWSASAYRLGMSYDADDVSWEYRSKDYLRSVRCVQDSP